ncbi:DUF3891 family protein [Pseudonocardia pini]|uniref:DUF3891 family protein n=1 Tax=Pseudonocardia pini TaxID=2758030 RepID=UPI0015F02B1F|nr:DUF3891 family protein [Pseudonocardia pini]
MIVRDDGDSWQVVLQPDHAALAGDLVAGWGAGPGFARLPEVASVERAGARHDDGWLAWEREPMLDATGAPKSFTAVSTALQMDFYRGAIAALEDVDPYAALLTSMHACGLYGADYGWTAPPLTPQYAAAAERFVADYHPTHERRRADLGLDEAVVRAGYDVLEVVDRISLYFCMRPDGAEYTIQRVVDADGTVSPLTITGVAPGVVALDPFPFATDGVRVELVRRVLPKREWADEVAFRKDFAATEPEARSLDLIPATREVNP